MILQILDKNLLKMIIKWTVYLKYFTANVFQIMTKHPHFMAQNAISCDTQILLASMCCFVWNFQRDLSANPHTALNNLICLRLIFIKVIIIWNILPFHATTITESHNLFLFNYVFLLKKCFRGFFKIFGYVFGVKNDKWRNLAVRMITILWPSYPS